MHLHSYVRDKHLDPVILFYEFVFFSHNNHATSNQLTKLIEAINYHAKLIYLIYFINLLGRYLEINFPFKVLICKFVQNLKKMFWNKNIQKQ